VAAATILCTNKHWTVNITWLQCYYLVIQCTPDKYTYHIQLSQIVVYKIDLAGYIKVIDRYF